MRNPGLKQRKCKCASWDEVRFAPGEKRQVEVANREQEKGCGDDERKGVSGINAGETRAPKFCSVELLAIVRVNEDET